MEEKAGFGFRPYDEELVGYYLRHKILGNDSLVDGVIREIKICSLDPWNLRFQSKIKSRDLVWYFLSRIENDGNRQSRKTPSGSWKLTGVPVDVNDQWGHLFGTKGKKIGHKRVLTFNTGNLESSISNSSVDKNKSDWVMHELHYTLLPEDERSYVMCRLEYKGEDVNILSADPTFAPTMANSASSVVDQGNSGYLLSEFDSGHQFSGIFDTHQSFPGYSDHNYLDWENDLPNQRDWFSDHLNLEPPPPQVPYSAPSQFDWHTQQQLHFLEETLMRDDPSHYRPKKPVTGVFLDGSSDSDTDSMIGRDDAWSSTDSVGSKDGPYHTPKDGTPPLNTVEPLHNHDPQEQPKQLELELELQLQGKEKVINKQKSECEWKMVEDSIKKAPSTSAVKQSWIVLEEISQRNSQWIYLMNIIIGFLLFVFIIGWIILVG